MKKLINYSLLFVVAILSISCSKDSSSTSLVGKWHNTADGEKGSGSAVIWTPVFYTDECSLQDSMELNSNGTITYQEYTTNTSTGACSLYVDSNPNSYSQTWVRSGDDVTITDTDFTTTPNTVFTYKARIISLTDSELIIQEYDDMNVNLADDYSKFSRH